MNIFFHKDSLALEGFTGREHAALHSAINEIFLVTIADKKGNIIYVNDTTCEASQYSREELIGKNYSIFGSDRYLSKSSDDLWKTVASGRTWKGEIRNKAKDGSYYWVDTSVVPILDNLKRVFQYIVVQFLITDRKEAERVVNERGKKLAEIQRATTNILEDVEQEKRHVETLAHDLEKFKFALEGISDQVIISDSDGIVLYANEALQDITGFSPQEALGKKAGSKHLWGGNMEKVFYEKMWHRIKIEKKTFKGELKNKKKDGTLYQAVSSISPIVDEMGNVVFFVAIERDVTKERQIDQAKTEFVSLASHQLRTPLSSINWYTEMLLSGDAGKLNAEQTDYLKEVYQGSHRMVDLVNSLLNISRLELGTFEVNPVPTEIKEVSQDVIQELQPMIQERRITVKEDYSHDLGKVNVDKRLIRIIFQNLLSNAVKYTPEKGVVEVGIKLRKTGEEMGDIMAFEDVLYIYVRDNGYGIPKGQQEKIFTKLFRADNARERETEGTGLGLYILQSIVKQAGGKVWFSSVENEGTIFHVLFPLSGMKKKEGTKSLT